ncbi:hypothetical protein KCU90_g802, partial [Aureobasidium melanogenum]
MIERGDHIACVFPTAIGNRRDLIRVGHRHAEREIDLVFHQTVRKTVPHPFHNLHTQIRPAREHAAHRERQHERRNACHRADANRSFRETAHRVDFLARVIGFALQQGGVRQQRAADRSKLHTLRVPFEQRRADLILEPFDGAAQRGLRDMQHFRGTAEAAARHNGGERMQLLKIESHAQK